jgi:hypothetical protein
MTLTSSIREIINATVDITRKCAFDVIVGLPIHSINNAYYCADVKDECVQSCHISQYLSVEMRTVYECRSIMDCDIQYESF